MTDQKNDTVPKATLSAATDAEASKAVAVKTHVRKAGDETLNSFSDEELARIPAEKLAKILQLLHEANQLERAADRAEVIGSVVERYFHVPLFIIAAIFGIVAGTTDSAWQWLWWSLTCTLFASGVGAVIDGRRRKLRQADTEELEHRAEVAERRLAEARKSKNGDIVADIAVEVFNLSSTKKSKLLADEQRKNQRLSTLFFFMSLLGPVASGLVLGFELNPQYLFASLALSGVPLTIAITLLRHDNRLRSHQRELEREIAKLERIRLAVDFSKTSTDPAFPEEMKKLAAKQIVLMSTDTGSDESTTENPDDSPLAILKMLVDRKEGG